MVAPQSDSEQVRYDVIIEAKAAIQAMREMLKYTTDNSTKMLEFTNQVVNDAKRWGMSWQEALGIYKQLNAELSKSKKATLFGNVGGQDLFKNSAEYLTSMEAAGRLNEEVAVSATNAGKAAEEMGNKGQAGAQKWASGLHFVRIALGALEAMLIFQIVQAFQNMVRGAINGLKELEEATYNLVNAEKTLSEQGIGITPDDLQGIINKVRELDPLLSKIQATELVSSIATRVAPQVGFQKEQIQQLAEAIAILSIRNKGLGKSFEEVEKQVTDAFLTGKVSVAINNLGIKINDQIVKDEALRLGLVKTADEFDNLTGKMEANIKARAMLSLITANANKDLAHLPDYFKTADAAFGIFQARWSDLLTFIGQKAGPLLRQIFTDLADLITKAINYLENNQDAWNGFVTVLMVIAKATIALIELMGKLALIAGKAGRAIYSAIGALPFAKQIFGEKPLQDTPTGPISASSSEEQAAENKRKAVAEAEDKIQDIMQESADKKLDIERDYARKLEDIARGYAQKLEDIARETAQKREDALRNYNQKVEDINRDANEKIAEANQEAKQKELDREKEFQNKLRELRDKLLFDLEDALHERDARQVLRLLRQYALDKKNLEERHQLERQQAKKDLADKLADIERERQLKLEAAKREYDEKLQQIAIQEARARQEAEIWHKRQLEDARLWHQRQLQEQREYLQRKLRDLAEAIAKEYQLTAAGAAAIYAMLSAYAGMASGLSGTLANNLSSSFTSALGGSTAPTSFGLQQPGIGSGLFNPYDVRARFAEGGTMVATRPTTVTFGEKGAEVAQFTPLSRPGNNVNSIFGDKSGLGVGGDVKIRLELSPDIEARIVDSSLENLSVHIERVNREK